MKTYNNKKEKCQKRFIKTALITCMFTCLPVFLLAENIRLSHIDPSTLLFNQSVKLYISVTDNNGYPVKGLAKNNFTLYESADNKKYVKIPAISGFKTMVNYESGINFLLMIDNSGSMYRSMKDSSGRVSNYIDNAKQAIKTFLAHVTNPRDRIGLVSYNAYYTEHAKLVADKNKLHDLLKDIKRPVGNAGYTELYASIYQAVESARSIKDRTVLIVLSDGENRPLYTYTGKKHKDYGEKVFTYSEPLDLCQKEGISVFAVNYGSGALPKDRMLQKIARDTGGAVFQAANSTELASVYSTIVNQVLHEYLVTYNATMVPADKRYVKVELKNRNSKTSATRFYFASTVFGIPLNELTPLLLYALIFAAILLWLLSKIKCEQKQHDANLSVLKEGNAQAVTKLLSLNTGNNGKTTIGSGRNADMTLVGNYSSVKDQHATVIYNEKRNTYTLISDGELKVNNKRVKTKILESGDVINVEGTSIVFDDGVV